MFSVARRAEPWQYFFRLRVHPPVLPSVAEAAAAIRLASAAASDAQRSAARPGVSPAAAAADSADPHIHAIMVTCFLLECRVEYATSPEGHVMLPVGPDWFGAALQSCLVAAFSLHDP